MDLAKLLESSRKEEEKLIWEGTFAQYLDMVTQNPKLARLSHARIYDMIKGAGVGVGRLGEEKYELFSGEIFGLERAIRQLVEYFSSAARRLEVRKRILLLLGPPASGKSTIANLIKRELEDYTRSDEGALYAIKGCPMQEEPLHLIPHKYREDLEREHGIYVEGDLCPRCRYLLRSVYKGKIDKVKVQRVAMSEKDGVGIGTFVATDPVSEDISRLVGSIDYSLITEDRLENAGRAFRLDGELNVANRGLMEFIEMLKLDEKFLTVLLGLTQEQNIKTGRFGMVYADEAILSHTNGAEFEAFIANKKTEALQDRIIVTKIPYNLKVSDEVNIYEKMLKESSLEDVHLAPLTLRVASIMAVLSRLEPPRRWGLSMINKLKLYDGQFVEDFTLKDVEEMQEQAPQEGMTGISPRYVMNRLSNTVSKEHNACINPDQALQSLWDGIEEHSTLAKEEREKWLGLFTDTRKEYDNMCKREMQKAFVDSFDESAEKLLNDYLAAVEDFCTTQPSPDSQPGEAKEAKEKLMRSLEEPTGIREHGKRQFREEIWKRFSLFRDKGVPFSYTMDERLEAAIEKKLFPDLKEVAGVIAHSKHPDPAQLKNREVVVSRLINSYGYCSTCAEHLLRRVARLLGVGEKGAGPKRLRWLWR